jgi:peptidoglycan DL-endopeptidase CwlO
VLLLAALVAGGSLLAGSGIAKAGSTSTTTASQPTTSTDSSTTTGITMAGDVKQQVDGLQAQAAAIQSEIDALDGQLEQATETYNQLCLQVDAIDKSLAELRRQQSIAQRNQDYHAKVLGERLAAMYKAGGREQYLEVLLSASGLTDFASRLRAVVNMATQDNQLISDLKSGTQELADFLEQIDAQKQTDLDLRKQVDEQARVVQTKLAERTTTLAGVQAQVATIIENERVRQEQEAIQLQEQLAAQLQAAQEASAAGSTFMSASGPLPLSNDPAANQLVETAAAYLGVPYVWAGDRPSTGFDCSGFTQYVFAQHGVSLPHFSVYQSQMGTPVDPNDLRVGDLLCFGLPVHHVGIYIGGGRFIHAPGTGQFVMISVLNDRHDLSLIRRFPIGMRTGPPAKT